MDEIRLVMGKLKLSGPYGSLLPREQPLVSLRGRRQNVDR